MTDDYIINCWLDLIAHDDAEFVDVVIAVVAAAIEDENSAEIHYSVGTFFLLINSLEE
jgi:hypothetical protein